MSNAGGKTMGPPFTDYLVRGAAYRPVSDRNSVSSLALESLKGKTRCRQVKFYSGVYALAIAMVLPFKDSEGGT
jgi:hypothetical protein